MSTKLPSEINHLSEEEAKWFAVYTGYKREKMVKKRLEQKGIHTFLPLQKVTRYYTSKIKHLELPLISCYVFVKIVKNQYVPVLEDPDVVKFVRVAKDLISIPEEEINILRQVVGEKLNMEVVERQPLQKGDWVEIASGRLFGMKGQLVEQKNDKNFVISLEQLGYDLFLQVDPKILRRVPKQ